MIDPSYKATITIHGSQAQISGTYHKALVREVTSYPVQGHQFSKAFQKKIWDGRKHLFHSKNHAFPTGLVSTVRDSLESIGVSTEVVDLRTVPQSANAGFDLYGASFEYPYDYQLDVCKTMIKKGSGVVKMATGSGKTEVACAVTKHLGLPTLFVVPTQELMYQSRERFKKRLQMDEKQVGIVGDGKWCPGTCVTIAMLATLEARINTPECLELLKSVDVLFLDEAHRAASETWYTVATLCAAYYRWGLSGTPLDRTDGANLRLIAATGDQLVDISNKFVVERGITARADIVFDRINSPILPKRTKYPAAYKQGVSENPELLSKIIQWTKIFRDEGLSVLILCEEINHGKTIDEALWVHEALEGTFIPHQFIHGSEANEVRQSALASFADRELPVLVGSTIIDEGVDVHSIDALILAGSRKSKIRTMQRLGRGLRGSKLIVVEFANFCHRYLLEHSQMRLTDYKAEECFPIHYSAPSAELVRSLWDSR